MRDLRRIQNGSIEKEFTMNEIIKKFELHPKELS